MENAEYTTGIESQLDQFYGKSDVDCIYGQQGIILTHQIRHKDAYNSNVSFVLGDTLLVYDPPQNVWSIL